MDLSNLIYLLIIVLVVFSQLKSMKKKTKNVSTADSDVESDSFNVDDMLRRLLNEEVDEPIYVEEQQSVSPQSSSVKEDCLPKHASVDTIQSTNNSSGLQKDKNRVNVTIRSREELKKAILYSEIIRRKY